MARAFERAREVGSECLQIFTRAPSRWQGRVLSELEVSEFRRAREEAGSPPVFTHDLYLSNLACPDPIIYRRSLESMVEEVTRGWALGVDGLVCHLGAHLGQGEEAGLRRYAEALREVLERTERSPLPILLETTAGQGSCLGHRFEHLGAVIAQLDREPRVGVCLDTCHVWAAGYDLHTGYAATWRAFEREVGRERLKLLHLNDSKTPLGSRVDRHANIGLGAIGDRGFRRILRDPELRGLPMIIETPEHATGHSVDLLRLKKLAGKRTRA